MLDVVSQYMEGPGVFSKVRGSPLGLGYDIIEQLLRIRPLRGVLHGEAALLAACVRVSWITGIEVGIVIVVIIVVVSVTTT